MDTQIVNIKYEKCDTFIGRGSIWGNPFFIGKDGNRKEVIEKYKEYILNKPKLLKRIPELKGKRLGCYCKPLPCHGDVLLELINAYT